MSDTSVLDNAYHQERVLTQAIAQDAERERLRPCVIYRPALAIDGDQWFALYGANLQDGVAGFGSSPAAAMLDFDKHWLADLPEGVAKAIEPSPSPVQPEVRNRTSVQPQAEPVAWQCMPHHGTHWNECPESTFNSRAKRPNFWKVRALFEGAAPVAQAELARVGPAHQNEVDAVVKAAEDRWALDCLDRDRYRWLRDKARGSELDAPYCVSGEGECTDAPIDGTALDAAIDAAMKGTL